MNHSYHCYQYWVEGKVQGVSYRFFTQQVATELGITGWVKNLPDGSVTLIACGNPEQLTCLENKLRQGPATAVVTTVSKDMVAQANFKDFVIKP